MSKRARKYVRTGDYGYVLEKTPERWDIAFIIYPSVDGYVKVEVPEDAKPMLRTLKNSDAARIKNERKERIRSEQGKGCTDKSVCIQCGECCHSNIAVKHKSSYDPVHEMLEIREQRVELDDPALLIERQESKKEIECYISKLTPNQQTVIRLHYYEDQKSVEISKLIGKSATSVSHIKDRALEKLKKIISQNVNFFK